MNRPEHTVVIDGAIDAVWLRDVCMAEAQKHYDRAANATQRIAVRTNLEKHEVFAKYADRFEEIRKEEVRRITEAAKGGSDASD